MGRYSWSTRKVIEEVPRLTIQELKKWDFLKKGKHSGIITFKARGIERGSLNITVIINSTTAGVIKFKYFLNGNLVEYSHFIELLPCHFGDYRFYFICRDTQKRVTALYMVGGYYSSRYFHNLVYQCSREHRNFFNLLNKSHNLINKAEWMERIGHPTKAKRYYRKAEIYELAAYDQVNNRFNKVLAKYSN